MGTAKVELADDSAAYFSDMAQRYQSLAMVEQHQAQSDLFATIAADYSELAAAAAGPPCNVIAIASAGAVARWLPWVGRWRRPAVSLTAPLPFPVEPTAAK
jgi:hypothetical protein